jgi:CRP-like cAMP-binding protein
MLLAHSAFIATFPIVPARAQDRIPGFEGHAIVGQKPLARDDVAAGLRAASAEAGAHSSGCPRGAGEARPIEYVYFIESGLASEIAVNGDRKKIEIAHVGSEGLVGKPVLLGLDRTPNEVFMQAQGSAFRIRAGELTKAMEKRPSIRALLLRYVHTCLIQFAHSALANGRYSIKERLARWLLTCHDRLGCDELPLTHEFLSLMLGVRRSGVTQALHSIEIEEAIRVQRGLIVVTDRRKLELVAGGSYIAFRKPNTNSSLAPQSRKTFMRMTRMITAGPNRFALLDLMNSRHKGSPVTSS